MSLIIIGKNAFPADFLVAEASKSDRMGVIINLFDRNVDYMSAFELPEVKGGVVVLSSTAVYGRESGDNLSAETAPIADDINSDPRYFLTAEESIRREAKCRGVEVAVLRTVDMIGTAMTGRWRRVAKGVYRATYHHIRDNKAKTSVVHAIDAAALAVKAVGLNGTFIVTDGHRYLVSDVAEALSSRFDHKRIPVFSLKQARIEAFLADLFTLGAANRREALRKSLLSLTFDGTEILKITGHKPIETLTYLKTHEYGQEDI